MCGAHLAWCVRSPHTSGAARTPCLLPGTHVSFFKLENQYLIMFYFTLFNNKNLSLKTNERTPGSLTSPQLTYFR